MDDSNVCEEKIFSRVYNDLGDAVWRFIYYKCGNSAQADDLVQEAFIKLWNNCAKVPLSKAKGFLFTVTNNAFLNEVAHAKVVLNHAKLAPSRVNHQTPEFLLEEQQYYKKLQAAIANLGEAKRTAFLLNRIEGKKYREIAEILDISIKAVEKRMTQALKELRKEFENV